MGGSGRKTTPYVHRGDQHQNRGKKSKAKHPKGEEPEGTCPPGSSFESEADSISNNGIEDEGEFDDVADVFESSYNFRFEEPYVVSRNLESGD